MIHRPTSLILSVLLLVGSSVHGYGQENQRPPLATLEILGPAADQALTGQVEVRVKVVVPQGAQVPKAMYAGFSSSAWTEMKPTEQPDQWTTRIDTSLVPNGAQTLRIVPDVRRVRAYRQVTVNNPLNIYFGDFHSHTSYSDGTLLPKVAHQYARDIAKLDVFCLTDHLNAVDDAEWLDMREQAEDANQDGRFVAIPGLEWSRKWGHMNILDPKTRHWPIEPDKLYQALADAGVTAKFNHPGDGTKDHNALAYSEVADRAVQLMEVRNPNEEQAYLRALKLGWHLAPDGSDDTHEPTWGTTRAWTGVLAPGLTQRNILDALANRHCYSTLDRNCKLRFQLNGATMGDVVEQPVNQVTVQVKVEDPDAADKIAKIELFEDGQVVQTDEPNAAGRDWTATLSPSVGPHWYFVKITQADGNLLWSAPIWVKADKSS